MKKNIPEMVWIKTTTHRYLINEMDYINFLEENCEKKKELILTANVKLV